MLNLFLKHEVDSETVGCFRESSGGGSENTIYGTALQLAVYTGDFGLTLWLLEHGVHFNGKNQKNNLSALHLATSKRLDGIIGILLTHGADIESLNDLGETPLHKAASSGYCNIVQLLIDHRANLEAVDRYGQTPLHMAASSRHRDIIQFLLDNKTST
ncbi:ankyrin repeat-containing domain protein [Pyronema domesticum]|nr:ankyrin repeat-containing domain protein [Pyronema domesticum]